jgi:hypothetical protein
MSPSSSGAAALRSGDIHRPARFHLLPPLLLVLALLDLRTELLLLADHFTLTSLLTAITTHPLAVVVLLAQPSLWRRYRATRPQP